MPLMPVNPRVSVAGGQIVPVALYDKHRNELARPGSVVLVDCEIAQHVRHEGALYVDERDYLDWMAWLRSADAKAGWPSVSFENWRERPAGDASRLSVCLESLRMSLEAALSAHDSPRFPEYIITIAQRLQFLMDEDLEGVMCLLLSEASTRLEGYAVSHCLVTAAVAHAVSKQLRFLSLPARDLVIPVSLTMNLSVLALQDDLVKAIDPISLHQSAQMTRHGFRSAVMLDAAGVSELPWLAAVEMHHDIRPIPLTGALTDAMAVARVVKRSDMYCAALSPRITRPALPASQAVRSVFLDEQGQPDLVGASILRVFGVCPPGAILIRDGGEIVLATGFRGRQGLQAGWGIRPGQGADLGRLRMLSDEQTAAYPGFDASALEAPLNPSMMLGCARAAAREWPSGRTMTA